MPKKKHPTKPPKKVQRASTKKPPKVKPQKPNQGRVNVKGRAEVEFPTPKPNQGRLNVKVTEVKERDQGRVINFPTPEEIDRKKAKSKLLDVNEFTRTKVNAAKNAGQLSRQTIREHAAAVRAPGKPGRKPKIEVPAKPPGLNSGSPDKLWLVPPTVEERVTFIIELLMTGNWAEGTTSLLLAKEWGVTISSIKQHQAEAWRRIRADEDGSSEKLSDTKRRYINLLERASLDALNQPEPDYRAAERMTKLASSFRGIESSNFRPKLEAAVRRICRIMDEELTRELGVKRAQEVIERAAKRLAEEEQNEQDRREQGD